MSRILSILFALIVSTSVSAQPVRTDYMESELVSEVSSIQPGQPFYMALRLKMDDKWHTYWRNPGDSGMSTSIQWTLPDGFIAGPIQWPYPEEIRLPPLVSYGYEGEIFLLTRIVPPAGLKPGDKVDIQALASWLVCTDICLPGEAGYGLRLPVKAEPAQPDTRWPAGFARTRAALPIPQGDWKFDITASDSLVELHALPPAGLESGLTKVSFFPYIDTIIDHAAPQRLYRTENGYLLRLRKSSLLSALPEKVEGVLVASPGWRGAGSERAMEIAAGAVTRVPPVTGFVGPVPASGTAGELENLWAALLFAFAGGIILNLMPCVLPMLSIKVLGFVHQAGEKHTNGWQHGVVFTLGVLLSFLALAGALLALRAGGEQLGWGFQLQSPAFLILLSAFVFLFGLSLFGVFEIGTSLANAGGKLDRGAGLSGVFVSGVMATVVATPCTAPFMGPALGFALTQSTMLALSVFGALGLGMAAPYMLLSSVPALLRFVPKPGAWMVSFKQFMGFLMMATVVWLAWVLGLQTGPDLVAMLLATLVVLGMAGWVLGKWGSVAATSRSRMTAWAVSTILAIAGVGFTLSSALQAETANPNVANSGPSKGLKWEPYSDKKLNELLTNGNPVFVDFTAAWCLSCQVNERVALQNADVVDAFERLKITALKADWTSRDPEITAALARFGRNSVPLYVLYFGDPSETPKILPEILTPGIVLEALEDIKVGHTARR